MTADLDDLARRMLTDYDARTPGRIFAEPCDLTPEQAYALQAEVARLRERRGERIVGYKVGCTSRAMQEQLGVNRPLFARLFATECHSCGARLDHRRYANLAVEGEVAVRLGRDLGPEAAAVDAIAAVFPVIELHHYVLRSRRPSIAELIANGGLHAGFVLADREAPWNSLAGLPELSLWIDGRRQGTATGADLARTAVHSVRWLAEQGLALTEGMVILTGSLLNLYTVQPGAAIVADLATVGRSTARA